MPFESMSFAVDRAILSGMPKSTYFSEYSSMSTQGRSFTRAMPDGHDSFA